MKKIYFSPLLWIVFINLSFGNISMAQEAGYEQEIKNWHQKRINSLKKETGWLNLAGLFWLKEGENTFGSDESNDIVFPKGKAASKMGKLTLKNGTVQIKASKKADIYEDSVKVNQMEVYTPTSDKNIVLKHRSLRWFIIKRGERYGIRLRDLESPILKNFTDIETFPINPAWRVKAFLEKAAENKTIPILDVLGNTTPTKTSGTLVFQLEGKEFRLDVVDEDGLMFIIFADESNGLETYASGRFLYCDAADAEGYTWLDFNKSYNPPCAFTDFATCPLPPRQNRLGIKILAGEKNYGHH